MVFHIKLILLFGVMVHDGIGLDKKEEEDEEEENWNKKRKRIKNSYTNENEMKCSEYFAVGDETKPKKRLWYIGWMYINIT